MTVRILHRDEVDGVVAQIMARPHDYTRDDLTWAAEIFGATPADVAGWFSGMDRAAVVMSGDVPIYLFAVDAGGCVHTLSDERLDGRYIEMTKAVLRFVRTPDGDAFFTDTIGRHLKSDLVGRGTAVPGWVGAMGFVPYAEGPGPGNDTVVYFHRPRG